ncbi:MAG TPA: SDR family oxidoreductase [Ohtaekwangia sp.]|uniref:SDR family oxidoreductase n=1 Tax=Ohtaekwangia sp. TaxID=2066019 RepID=UPI002F93D28C
MENQNRSLAGKKVIVLGGTSGIGLAAAKAAAAEGAQVSVVSSNKQRVDQALLELPAGSTGYAIDLSNEKNIKDFFVATGKFDHLIYTAGENLTLNSIADLQLDKAREFFNLRYWGALAAVKYASPYINAGGSISLTSGIASTRPGSGWSIASSICGAMEGLVRALAVELAPIRVNSVVPGVVKTNLWNSMTPADRESLYTNVGNSLLVKRVGEAEDIAQTFLYLMKQQFGTGQNIVVDGGTVLV